MSAAVRPPAIAVLLLGSGWLTTPACMNAGEASHSEALDLALGIPDAAELLEVTGPAPTREGTRFTVRALRPSDDASGWSTSSASLALEIDERDPAMMTLSSQRGRIGIRRLGAGGAARIQSGRLLLSDALFVPRAEGIEELVYLEAGERAIEYDVALPRGWRLHAPAGYPDTVEVLDTGGLARFRTRASEAWDAEGRPLQVVLAIEGERIRLTTPAAPIDTPVLIDPLWQDAGEVTTARREARSVVLPSGRVATFGGAPGFGGTALGLVEVFDPTTLTFTLADPLLEPRVDPAVVALQNGKVLIAGGITESLVSTDGQALPLPAIATAELFDPMTHSIEPAGSLTEGRARATATLLRDGRVLIAGGTGSGMTLASAELYDPETGAFTPLPAMPSPRQEHTATLLPNGDVLLAGGTNGSTSLDTTVVFDADAGAFTPGPSMNEDRFGHMAVPLPGDQVLILDGKSKALMVDSDVRASAEILDLTQPIPSFMSVPEALCPGAEVPAEYTTVGRLGRFRGSALLLPSGEVLIASGQISVMFVPLEFETRQVAVFDPVAACFRIPPDTPFGALSPFLGVLPTGKAILLGRAPAAQLLDLSLTGNAVTEVALDEPVEGLTSTILSSGEVLLTGGRDASGALVTSARRFDPPSESFSPTQGAPVHARLRPTATGLHDGTVLITGGFDEAGAALDSAEIYDPSSDAFEAIDGIGAPRGDHTATLLPDGRVLVVGGFSTGGDATTSIVFFDPVTRTIADAGFALPAARGQHSATLLVTGDVLVAGGRLSASSPAANEAWLVDLEHGEVIPAGSLKDARARHIAAPLPDGRVLLAGGSESGSAEIYEPTAGTFGLTASLPEPRFGASAVVLPSGNVALFGGLEGAGEMVERPISIFDPVSDTWSTALGPDPNTGLEGEVKLTRDHNGGAATVLPDGSVMVFGGSSLEAGGVVLDAVAERLGRAVSPLDAGYPVLSGAPQQVAPGGLVALTGDNLPGFADVIGGVYGSNARLPAPLWLSLGGTIETGTLSRWTDTEADWRVPAPRYPGPGILFMVSHGLRSIGAPVNISGGEVGVTCTVDSQCTTGFCTDGVCCDQRCDDGICMACSAAKKQQGEDGQCGPVAAMVQPEGEGCPDLSAQCPGAETAFCDGSGQCATCPLPPVCDGEHSLVLGEEIVEDCSPLKCSPERDQCLEQCTRVGDCIAGYVCTADGTCALPPSDDVASACAASPTSPAGSRGGAALLLAALALGFRRARGPLTGVALGSRKGLLDRPRK